MAPELRKGLALSIGACVHSLSVFCRVSLRARSEGVKVAGSDAGLPSRQMYVKRWSVCGVLVTVTRKERGCVSKIEVTEAVIAYSITKRCSLL